MPDLNKALIAAAAVQRGSDTMRTAALAELIRSSAHASRATGPSLVALVRVLPAPVLAEAPYLGIFAAEAALAFGDVAGAGELLDRVQQCAGEVRAADGHARRDAERVGALLAGARERVVAGGTAQTAHLSVATTASGR